MKSKNLNIDIVDLVKGIVNSKFVLANHYEY